MMLESDGHGVASNGYGVAECCHRGVEAGHEGAGDARVIAFNTLVTLL
jgi:hypothetical protein